MPSIMPEGIRVPVGGDSYDLTNDLRKMMESTTTVIPAVNDAARGALLALLVAASRAPTAAKPIIVRQGDTGDFWTHNGAGWTLIGPGRASFTPIGANVAGIQVPTFSMPDIDARLNVKTGRSTFFTTTSFGNEYAPTVVFPVPFPNAAVAVLFTQIHTDGAAAFPGGVALDSLDRTSFRALYPGATGTVKRAFLYTAVGY